MEMPLHFSYGHDDSDIEVTFLNQAKESVALTHLQGKRYRLESSSLFGEPQVFYGDVVEIEMTGERAGLFRRIVERSGFRVLDRILGSQITESPLFQQMLERIIQFGGNWERFFGGVLLVHLPPESEFNIDAELKDIAQSLKGLTD